MIWVLILGAMVGFVIGGLMGFWFGWDRARLMASRRDDLLKEAARALAIVGIGSHEQAYNARMLATKIIEELIG